MMTLDRFNQVFGPTRDKFGKQTRQNEKCSQKPLKRWEMNPKWSRHCPEAINANYAILGQKLSVRQMGLSPLKCILKGYLSAKSAK